MPPSNDLCPQTEPALESAPLLQIHDEPSAPPPAKIERELAHALNNILMLIQGHSDRLIMRHGQDSALRPDLQLISESARRAAYLIRVASMRKRGYE